MTIKKKKKKEKNILNGMTHENNNTFTKKKKKKKKKQAEGTICSWSDYVASFLVLANYVSSVRPSCKFQRSRY